jgi:hypothetical protein
MSLSCSLAGIGISLIDDRRFHVRQLGLAI